MQYTISNLGSAASKLDIFQSRINFSLGDLKLYPRCFLILVMITKTDAAWIANL